MYRPQANRDLIIFGEAATIEEVVEALKGKKPPSPLPPRTVQMAIDLPHPHQLELGV